MNSLRAQNNTQGASDMGCTPDFLPGYQPIGDEKSREKFEQAWDQAIPGEAGLHAAEILSAAAEGKIDALYILGEDLLNTSPEAASLRAGLEACEFVVVQEIAASVFTPAGFATAQRKWEEGTLEPGAMRTIAQMGGLLIDQKDVRFPDGPAQRVINLLPPKDVA